MGTPRKAGHLKTYVTFACLKTSSNGCFFLFNNSLNEPIMHGNFSYIL
jgi:hypothetical protein